MLQSKEIRDEGAIGFVVLWLLSLDELEEVGAQMFVDFEYSGTIATLLAVIGCRPDSDKSLLKPVLVALIGELVGPADEAQVVEPAELLGDEFAK
jgi:hypothetical protein